jgi:hypothetical protein
MTLGKRMDPKLKFEDVKGCKTVEQLYEFITQYLDEGQLQGQERRKTYWALFYAWKENTSLANE